MMELSTYDGLKESARKGLALALIAESNIMREVERGDLVIVNTVGLPLEYTIYLAHRTGKLSPALSIAKTAALNSRLNRAISRCATHADVVREPSLTLS